MKFNQNTAEGVRASLGKKQMIAIAVVLALGAVGTVSILRLGGSAPAAEEKGDGHGEAKGHGDDEHHGEAKGEKGHKDADSHADGEHHEEAKKGANGGDVLGVQKGFSVELLLAEEGGAPRIKAWVTNAGKPVKITADQMAILLERPGQDPEKISVTVQGGVLVSAKTIEEPHLFKGAVSLQTAEGPVSFPFEKDEGAVTMTAEQIKTAGVSIESSGPAQIRTALQLPGEIAFNEDKTAHVVPRVGGVVESVAVSLGQQVTKGQVLAVTCSIRRCRRRKSSSLRTLAVGPTGMSINACVAPAAIFFDSTDATSWASLSRSSGLSTRMSTSSAGLRVSAPPQTRQPPSRSTTRRMAVTSRSTRVSVSITSAVPAGDVIARDDVFGIVSPAAATMATTIGVVRLPGRPPTQCLSAIGARPQSIRSHRAPRRASAAIRAAPAACACTDRPSRPVLVDAVRCAR